MAGELPNAPKPEVAGLAPKRFVEGADEAGCEKPNPEVAGCVCPNGVEVVLKRVEKYITNFNYYCGCTSLKNSELIYRKTARKSLLKLLTEVVPNENGPDVEAVVPNVEVAPNNEVC